MNRAYATSGLTAAKISLVGQIVRWADLDSAQRKAVLLRPALSQSTEIGATVQRIVDQVRADGDATLRALTRRYDGHALVDLAVCLEEMKAASAQVGAELKQAIVAAKQRIEFFHRATASQDISLDTAPGVRCERVSRPIDRVGLYVPAGTAPLPSTALMLGVPAQIAQCPQIIMCTPADKDGRADAAVLYTAELCGIGSIYKVGGAQAIAAMACGTETISACDKLFGPGNAYVTEAKRRVAAEPGGPAIDMPAGPSEVLIIADETVDPEFVASDLLAQAEHGPDSQVILVASDAAVLHTVIAAVRRQLAQLPRAKIAAIALASSRFILCENIAQAFDVSNSYAPEHLILALREPRKALAGVRNAGSVFLGAWTPEAVGDYCSGTNHVLPTYGHARAWSGISVASFQKLITVQELTPDGLRGIGPDACTMARAECLDAHAYAVTIRLQTLERQRA